MWFVVNLLYINTEGIAIFFLGPPLVNTISIGFFHVGSMSEYEERTLAYLAILNSNVMWFFLTQTGTQLRGGFFRFMTRYMEPFPLPELSEESAGKLSSLADAIMAAKKQLAAFSGSDADRSLLEQRIQLIDSQINALVYKLYGLTAEEICIVEGK